MYSKDTSNILLLSLSSGNSNTFSRSNIIANQSNTRRFSTIALCPHYLFIPHQYLLLFPRTHHLLILAGCEGHGNSKEANLFMCLFGGEDGHVNSEDACRFFRRAEG